VVAALGVALGVVVVVRAPGAPGRALGKRQGRRADVVAVVVIVRVRVAPLGVRAAMARGELPRDETVVVSSRRRRPVLSLAIPDRVTADRCSRSPSPTASPPTACSLAIPDHVTADRVLALAAADRVTAAFDLRRVDAAFQSKCRT
jgi:hypothetical protein